MNKKNFNLEMKRNIVNNEMLKLRNEYLRKFAEIMEKYDLFYPDFDDSSAAEILKKNKRCSNDIAVDFIAGRNDKYERNYFAKCCLYTRNEMIEFKKEEEEEDED